MPEKNADTYEEIDLWELVLVLKKRFKIIAALVLLAVLSTGLINFIALPPVYESSLMIDLPGDLGVGTTADGYYELARSQNVFKKAKSILAYEKDIDTLRNHFKLELDRKIENGEVLSEFLKVSAFTNSPEVCVQYCNAWLEAFNQEVRLFMEDKLAKEKNLAQEVLTQRTDELAQTEEELGAFDRRNPISLKESELRVLENDLVQGEKTLRDLEMTIPTDQVRLEFLEQTLAGEKETLDGKVGTSLYPDSSAAGVTSSNVTILNPVYLSVSQDLTATRVSLVANQEKAKLQKEYNKILQEKTSQLRGDLVLWRLERERLVRNEAEAKRLYNDSRSAYEKLLGIEASLSSLASSRLVVEPALPLKAVGPRKLFNTALAGIFSLFIGVFFAFGLEWIAHSKEKRLIGQSNKNIFSR